MTIETADRFEVSTESTHHKSAVGLEFKSPYSSIITRRVGKDGVYGELAPFNAYQHRL